MERLVLALSLKINVSGVYISYPFCAQKCTYCNFASGVFPRDLEARYRDALAREIAAHAWEWTPTPSTWAAARPAISLPMHLRALLDLVPGRPWAEATIEAAPGSITPETARAWAAAGINRVCLGVQSFVEKEIRRTGRKHTAAIVAAEIAMLRAAGIRNINIDLIAGLSGQTEASWRESLDWIERLAPDTSRSTCSKWTRTAASARRCCSAACATARSTRPPTMPPPISTRSPWSAWPRSGSHATRSPISRAPACESLHNLKYWTLQPYAGFGADAHSFDGRMRRQNPESLEDYLSGAGQVTMTSRTCPKNGSSSACASPRAYVPTPRNGAASTLPSTASWMPACSKRDGGILRLTNRGVLLSNEVFQEFLNP